MPFLFAFFKDVLTFSLFSTFYPSLKDQGIHEEEWQVCTRIVFVQSARTITTKSYLPLFVAFKNHCLRLWSNLWLLLVHNAYKPKTSFNSLVVVGLCGYWYFNLALHCFHWKRSMFKLLYLSAESPWPLLGIIKWSNIL